MKQSNPEWYDALQGNPLKEKTFTDQLALKIKTQVILSPGKERSIPRRLSLVSTAMICVLGLILFANERERFTPIITTGFSSVNAPNTSSSSGIKDDQTHAAKSLTDSEWQELINQKDPNSYKEILYTQSVSDNVMLVFSRKLDEAQGIQALSLGFDLFKRTTQKWNWEQSVFYDVRRVTDGTFYNQANNKEISKDGLITARSGLDNIPLFYGLVLDPEISQIRITDENQIQQIAKIISFKDGYTYWFAALPSQTDGYKLEKIDSEGRVIATETYKYD